MATDLCAWMRAAATSELLGNRTGDKWIGTVTPANVIALCEQNERLRAALEEARSVIIQVTTETRPIERTKTRAFKTVEVVNNILSTET